jgi:hypothetical protein
LTAFLPYQWLAQNVHGELRLAEWELELAKFIEEEKALAARRK